MNDTVYAKMHAWLTLFHDIHTCITTGIPGMSNTLLLTTPKPSAHDIIVPFSASEGPLIVATDVSVEFVLAVNLTAMLSAKST